MALQGKYHHIPSSAPQAQTPIDEQSWKWGTGSQLCLKSCAGFGWGTLLPAGVKPQQKQTKWKKKNKQEGM